MLLILLSWIIISAVFLAFGDMALVLWNKATRTKERYGLFGLYLIGMCTTGLIATILSLFLPIDIYVLVVLIFISANYIFIRQAKFIELFRTVYCQFETLSKSSKAAIIFSVTAIAVYSLSAPILYDFGLYHLQSIMWTEAYHVVPGLGNIHGRLGFNSCFLLLSALFGYHPEYYSPIFAINSISTLLFSVWLIIKISEADSIIRKIILAIIPILFYLSFLKYISSTSTDILTHIIVIYTLLQLVLGQEPVKNKYLYYIAIPLFCVTLKLSASIIILVALFAFITMLRNKQYRILSCSAILGAIIIIPWCIRFVVLTGYLIYPFPSIDLFDPDWKMPLQMVIDEKESATAWARATYRSTSEVMAMPFGEWFGIWIKALRKWDLLLYIIATISPIIVLLNRKNMAKNNNLIAWTITLCGFIFCFFSAPDPRFGFGFIVCCAFIPFLTINSKTHKTTQETRSKIDSALSLCLIAAFIGFIGLGIRQVTHYQGNLPVKTLIFKPQPVNTVKNNINATFTQHETSDFIIYSPDKDNRCFDQCLPCTTPEFAQRNIELRGTDFRQGFRIKK